MTKKKWKSFLPPFRTYKKKVLTKALLVSSFIHQAGESPNLRKPSKLIPIKKIKTKEYQNKFNYLKKCLLKYRKLTGYGRGITAVQVGIPEKFAVIYSEDKPMIFIDPKVTKVSKKLLKFPEGCMSLNPLFVPVVRPSWVEFDYYDEEGNLHKWNTKDKDLQGKIMNRVFQHEIDHMEGILNIEKAHSLKEVILESDPDFYTKAKFEEVG